MGLLSNLPSTTTLYTAYASISSSIMMIRSIANEILPQEIQTQMHAKLKNLFGKKMSAYRPLTLVIKKYDNGTPNQVYEAAEYYLRSKITPSIDRLRVFKRSRDEDATVVIDAGQEVTDVFRGIKLRWMLKSPEKNSSYDSDEELLGISYELEFDKKYNARVRNSYLPYILKRLKEMQDEDKEIFLHKLSESNFSSYSESRPTRFEHPATFNTLALDGKLKKEIIDDLERFIKRKDFYKRVGRAWKRGYLLYGPPGTGKSTLIAAMANYLKFDIYDLELANCRSNDQLRILLGRVKNKSILVIEDIDCSVTVQDRKKKGASSLHDQLTLSGVLNMIDGLWSSCGDERIIIFTTNHKERLDPALLRPGRMDMHVHMSYCTKDAFGTLANTYLGIPKDDKNKLYLETKDWIEKCQVTTAQIAEELMKSEDVEIALSGLLKFLKQKKNQTR